MGPGGGGQGQGEEAHGRDEQRDQPVRETHPSLPQSQVQKQNGELTVGESLQSSLTTSTSSQSSSHRRDHPFSSPSHPSQPPDPHHLLPVIPVIYSFNLSPVFSEW